MGRRGPHTEPAAVKKAKGNPGRRKIGEDPPADAHIKQPPLAAVSAPKFLKKAALRIWKERAPHALAMRLMTENDAYAFARYCMNFARWLDANKYLDEEGSHYNTETGYDRVRSAMMISLRLDPVLERAEDRFGLNPAERQRIFAQRAALPPGFGDLFGAPADGEKPGEDAPNTDPGGASPIGYLQ